MPDSEAAQSGRGGAGSDPVAGGDCLLLDHLQQLVVRVIPCERAARPDVEEPLRISQAVLRSKRLVRLEPELLPSKTRAPVSTKALPLLARAGGGGACLDVLPIGAVIVPAEHRQLQPELTKRLPQLRTLGARRPLRLVERHRLHLQVDERLNVHHTVERLARPTHKVPLVRDVVRLDPRQRVLRIILVLATTISLPS